MSERAVCARCGGLRPDLRAACPDCGHAPDASELPLAWLLSERWLGEAELLETARRISAGQRPDPDPRLLAKARAALDEARVGQGPGLGNGGRAAVLLGDVLLTPLIGYALWFGLRQERPVAAREALLLTLPVTLALGLAWLGVVLLSP